MFATSAGPHSFLPLFTLLLYKGTCCYDTLWIELGGGIRRPNFQLTMFISLASRLLFPPFCPFPTSFGPFFNAMGSHFHRGEATALLIYPLNDQFNFVVCILRSAFFNLALLPRILILFLGWVAGRGRFRRSMSGRCKSVHVIQMPEYFRLELLRRSRR